MQKIILNADDFGKNDSCNNAIINAIKFDYLKSISVIVNTDDFLNIIEVIKANKHISYGVHLNLTEGCCLSEEFDDLSKNNFINILIKSNNKKFLNKVENEFKAQIELAKKYFQITHIDSHIHIHAIPNIFKIVLKLANEYNIPFIRTQYEKSYFIFNKKYFNMKYFINLIKVILLNFFTCLNKKELRKYPNIRTNDTIIGINYSGIIDSTSVLGGIKKNKSDLIEVIIHPNNENDDFQITKDEMLFDLIKIMGFELTNFQSLENML